LRTEERDSRETDDAPHSGIPRGLRYMATGAFFFSVMSLLVKLAGRGVPSQEIVFARSLIMTVLSFALLRRQGIAPLGRQRGLLIVRGLFGFAALSCFYYAIVHLPLADATVIQYTNPVFTALLAAVLLSERLRLREVGLVLVSLAGVVLMARPAFLFGGVSERLDMVAAGIALLGAVLSAGAYVTVRRLGATEDPLVIVFYFAALSTIGSLPLTAMDAVMPTAAEWAALAGIGVLTQFGQVLMTKGLRAEAAGRAMAVGYMQIVFAAIWGALFFAEFPDLWGFAGALLIVAGTFGIARR
ncbi:MAG TPA: DMT family transporter, partial [Longimicrobiales bacterium]|nr:DMT family transporter [Longimicrobiales bacterium]